MYSCVGGGLKIRQWEWSVHQDVPLASCMEIHLHGVVQIAYFELQLYKWRRDVVEHSWDPRRVSPRWPSCCLPQQLQQPPGSALDSKPGRGRTSFTPTQRARSEMKQWRGWENRKAAFNLMDLCPEYTYKNHSRFSFSRRSVFGGCLVSYIIMCNSLSVAICTWACMTWSRKPHPHTKKPQSFTSSGPWLVQQGSQANWWVE